MGVTGGDEAADEADRLGLPPRAPALLHLLLPAACLGCAAPLPRGPAPFGLCLRCRGRLLAAPPPGRRCRGCAAPLAAPRPARGLCGRCRRAPPPYASLTAPWAYRPPLRDAIRALKFRRLAWVGARLAAPLASALAAGPAAECELVVPVPLHWRRRLARGFDQAAAIARPLACRLGLPALDALVRRRATPPQSALPRAARRANLAGAFAVRRRRAVTLAGRRVLLVDDVATTGATLAAAAAALLAAGAAEVHAAAVARTPAEPPPGVADPVR
jgi:ComF family protein